ncbi:hypothetical protein GGQ88_003633 [Novosphingobium hassiacum]|uniref:Extradiol ring-cleavage dioxygenase LigAB LigA subunit domain-containing protein n=1 Tax=Novosphingobium hassiacum TaxID=173676 RepID=A0A7W6A069_9SPHN|nr:hypothetical protein [Novosphingobium hassiacum]MBB3862333.1 hypothetical protein [Novosphingobium hassiacum]
MSTNAMEVVLFRLANQPEDVARFRADPDTYLAEHKLDSSEVGALRAMDIEGMAAIPVNWMLMMGAYQALHGRPKQPEYLQRIRSHATRRPVSRKEEV